MAAGEKPFFVYELVDPRNGWIFMLVKGEKIAPAPYQRGQIWKNPESAMIRQILAAGFASNRGDRAPFSDGRCSLQFRKAAHLGVWPQNLTNVTPGGRSGGGVGSSDDPDILMVYVLATLYRGLGIAAGLFDYHGARVPYTIEDKRLGFKGLEACAIARA